MPILPAQQDQNVNISNSPPANNQTFGNQQLRGAPLVTLLRRGFFETHLSSAAQLFWVTFPIYYALGEAGAAAGQAPSSRVV